MKITTKQDKKGFTIIEVVLVLAIAGLIFLIVFLAVPALQRSQRDTQRRNDLGRFMSQITNFQSNSQGAVPAGTNAAITGFRDTYMIVGDDQFQDPSTNVPYVTQGRLNSTGARSATLGTITYFVNAKCDAANTTNGLAAGTGGRTVAAQIPLEGGGFFCQDNV